MSNTTQTGSINIGRDNNGTAAVHNYYGPRQMSFTGNQLGSIFQAVKPFAGHWIELSWEFNQHIDAAAEELRSALNGAGLSVVMTPAYMVGLPNGRRIVENGLAFGCREGDDAILRVIAHSLQKTRFLGPNERIPISYKRNDVEPGLPTVYIGKFMTNPT